MSYIRQVYGELIDELLVLARLMDRIEQAGSQEQFAREAGVSAQYVSDVLHKRRDFGPKLLKALGLERVTMYREVRHRRADTDNQRRL